MKVELHLHTSRYSGCAILTAEQAMWKLTECGYDAVYITEHDAVWEDRELAELRADFPRMLIFPGLERSLGSNGTTHLLVLGTNDPDYLAMRSAPEIIARARDEGHLTVLAHPFRWQGGEKALDCAMLPDAIEYRTCNHGTEGARTAERIGPSLNLPLVNAGDVHALGFVDRFWIDTDRDLGAPDDIRRIILDGAYLNRGGGGAGE